MGGFMKNFVLVSVAFALQAYAHEVVQVPTIKEITLAAAEVREVLTELSMSMLKKADGVEDNSEEHDSITVQLAGGELKCFIGRQDDPSREHLRDQSLCLYKGFVFTGYALSEAESTIQYSSNPVRNTGPISHQCLDGLCKFWQNSANPKAIEVSVVGSGLLVDAKDEAKVMDVIRSYLEYLEHYVVVGHGMEGGKVMCLEFGREYSESDYEAVWEEFKSIKVNERNTEYGMRRLRSCRKEDLGGDLEPLAYLRFPGLEKASLQTVEQRAQEKAAELKKLQAEKRRTEYLDGKIKEFIAIYLSKMNSSLNDLSGPIYMGAVISSVTWEAMTSYLKFKNGSVCQFDGGLHVQTDRAGGEVTVGYPADLLCYKSQPDWMKGTPKPDWIVKGSDVQLSASYCPVGRQGRSGESYCWESER
jgi:hypothetical protein